MKAIHLSIVYFCLTISSLFAAGQSWTEDPADPIYNPFVSINEDYFPYVIYNRNLFNGDGDSVFYKMWHQGPNGIALSYSNDGVTWNLRSSSVVPGNAFHASVLYDQGGFGGGIYKYKMWFWTGVASTTVDAIQYCLSLDGVNWTPSLPITQDPLFPLAVGVAGEYFYHLYCPGFVQYNPSATSQPGQPYTFPYIMLFDTATEGLGPGTSVEQIGLAYSTDGIFWTRYGTEPIFIPSGNTTDWDGSHAFRPSLQVVQGVYNMYYSGSNENIPIGIPYAHGIGLATSTDGITWTRDSSNPIFICSDGVAWRNSRTYTPFVLFGTFTDAVQTNVCQFKMWFTGGSGDTAGTNQGIGYATAPCPETPILPPNKFCGKIKRKHHLHHHKHFILKTKWKPSPSQDVSFYRIYEKKKIVKKIKVTKPLFFKDKVHSHRAWKKFSITAVNTSGTESTHKKLRIEKP